MFYDVAGVFRNVDVTLVVSPSLFYSVRRTNSLTKAPFTWYEIDHISSAYLLLRDSKDPLVSSSVPRILTGQTWHVEEAVKFAESDLSFREKFGQTNLTGAGLGLKPRKPTPQIGTHDYRKLISDIVCEEDDKTRFAKAVQQSVQGQWTAWERYVQTNLSWITI